MHADLPAVHATNSITSSQPPLLLHAVELAAAEQRLHTPRPARLSQKLLLRSSRHCTPTSTMHVTRIIIWVFNNKSTLRQRTTSRAWCSLARTDTSLHTSKPQQAC